MLPLFLHKDRRTLANVARLWTVVLLANMAGALLISWTLAKTAVLSPEVHTAVHEIASESLKMGFGLVILRGIFAGWLIAMLVWMLPFAESARFFLIVGMTWLIGLGGFAHVVAGAVEVMFLGWGGAAPWHQVVGSYIVPALAGNILGGVTLVAIVNHGQVVS